MNRTAALQLLLDAGEADFKAFNDRIVNCHTAPSIGVRVPVIRQLAAKIAKGDWAFYIEEMEQLDAADPFGDGAAEMYQEERMLWGIVLGLAKMSIEERTAHLDRWVSGILSWGECDTSVSTFKFMKKDQEYWYDYCMKWMRSGSEFPVRFALVALMQYFIQEEYIEQVLQIFAQPQIYFAEDKGRESVVSSRETAGKELPYYIRMAQAWALSVCFVKFRDRTWEVLNSGRIDAWVQNKAIQKCRESYRVSAEDKELLKSLKK